MTEICLTDSFIFGSYIIHPGLNCRIDPLNKTARYSLYSSFFFLSEACISNTDLIDVSNVQTTGSEF